MSQLRHVELADECESIKTNTNYVLAGLMTGHRAGSRACSWLNFCGVFFFAKKIEPATRRWASYEALSQLRGTEPATWHWASKVALSFIIHIPMQSKPYNILNLGQNNVFWGRHVPLSWSGNVKSNIRVSCNLPFHEAVEFPDTINPCIFKEGRS